MIPAKPAANAIQLRNGLQRFYFRFLAAAAMVVVSAPAVPTFGQLGSAWVSTSYTKKIHLDDDIGLQTFNWTSYKSVCSPVCADYSYDSSTDTETFRLLDGRTNRSEIRLQNEYSAGIRQFEGYVTFYSPLNDESLFQIFGSTDGATLCMMRGYSSNGGKIHVVGGIGDIQLNTYGVERRINVIHNQNKYVQFYVIASSKASLARTNKSKTIGNMATTAPSHPIRFRPSSNGGPCGRFATVFPREEPPRHPELTRPKMPF
jgi:hypothetical protein